LEMIGVGIWHGCGLPSWTLNFEVLECNLTRFWSRAVDGALGGGRFGMPGWLTGRLKPALRFGGLPGR
jgi:hypothetical protein